MSTGHHAATRHSPPVFKKSALKTARSVPSAKSALAPKITVKGAAVGHKTAKQAKEKDDEVFKFEDEEDEMTTSFLQYWYVSTPSKNRRDTGFLTSVCIVLCVRNRSSCRIPRSCIVPKGTSPDLSYDTFMQRHDSLTVQSVSSCRRRDASSPISGSFPSLNLNSPTTKTPRDRMAEYLSSSSLPNPLTAYPFPSTGRPAKEARIPAMAHEGKTDLDPTEWKPADPDHSSNDDTGGGGPGEMHLPIRSTSPAASSLASGMSSPSRKPKLLSRNSSSEAFTYLAQFHRSSDSLSGGGTNLSGAAGKRRPGLRGHHGTPSLSFTSTTRSEGTSAGGSGEDSAGNSECSSLAGTSMSYEYVARSTSTSVKAREEKATTALTTTNTASSKTSTIAAITGVEVEDAGTATLEFGRTPAPPAAARGGNVNAQGSLKRLLNATTPAL